MDNHYFKRGIIRTPVFSYDLFRELIKGTVKWDELLNNDVFLNSIYIASSELYAICQQYQSGQLDDARKLTKFKNAILKYAYRASTRCTPFGLFSGLGVATIGADQTDLVLGSAKNHVAHARIDMDFLGSLAKEVGSYYFIKPYLRYHVNSSLYKLGESYRFVEYQYYKTIRKFDLASVEYTPIIEQILQASAGGSFIDVLAHQIEDEDVNFDEAREFVECLMEAQVLVSELELSTTGEEAGHQLLHTLQLVQSRITDEEHQIGAKNVVDTIADMLTTLSNLDTAGKQNVAAYARVKEKAKLFGIDFNEKFLVQCDAVLKFERPAQMNESLIETVNKGLRVLQKFIIKSEPNAKMVSFIKSFTERYEDREVSLVEALDVETGIGYAQASENSLDITDFIDDLSFGPDKVDGKQFYWSNVVHSYFAKKITEAHKKGATVVQITDEELASLPDNEADLPEHNTYACSVSLLEDGHGQPTIALNGGGGHTAVSWLGRFCHSDSAIEALALEITAAEEKLNSHKIVAEINHLPQDRLGNVLQRPILRSYEIPFLANTSIDREGQIPISDLLLSVRQGKIVLRSKKHAKEVLPYISSALFHDKDTLPIFHFLGDIQLESNNLSLLINLGVLPAIFKFIPRIQYKNTILKRASWVLDEADIKTIGQFKEATLFEEFNAFADANGLPECFTIQHFDNELVINRTNKDAVSVLMEEIKDKTKVVLLEYLLASYRSPVTDAAGRSYNNEVLVFFANDKKQVPVVAPTPHTLVAAKKPAVARDFIPGSEWVYFKIYTGFKFSDKLLNTLKLKLDELLDDGVLDKWFYIRYADPKTHIRLRLRLADVTQITVVFQQMSMLLEGFKSEGLVTKIMLDTYSRELERYGHSTIHEVESIFFHDSALCCDVIDQIPDELRWLAALYSTHTYLKAFGFRNEECLHLTNTVKGKFEKEFGAIKETRKTLNVKYNTNREIINLLLDQDLRIHSTEELEYLSIVTNLVENRNQNIADAVAAIRHSDLGEEAIASILVSLIHMNINRLFRSKQRIFEYCIYDLLKSYYTSSGFRKNAAQKLVSTVA